MRCEDTFTDREKTMIRSVVQCSGGAARRRRVWRAAAICLFVVCVPVAMVVWGTWGTTDVFATHSERGEGAIPAEERQGPVIGIWRYAHMLSTPGLRDAAVLVILVLLLVERARLSRIVAKYHAAHGFHIAKRQSNGCSPPREG